MRLNGEIIRLSTATVYTRAMYAWFAIQSTKNTAQYAYDSLYHRFKKRVPPSEVMNTHNFVYGTLKIGEGIFWNKRDNDYTLQPENVVMIRLIQTMLVLDKPYLVSTAPDWYIEIDALPERHRLAPLAYQTWRKMYPDLTHDDCGKQWGKHPTVIKQWDTHFLA